MIRIILAGVWVVLFLIVTIPVQLVELVVGLFSKRARATSSMAMVNFAFKGVLFFAGTKIIVKGREKVPTDEAVLYVPNHRSIFDVLLVYPLSNRATAFVAKKEVKKVPLLSSWMSLMNCQFLDRSDLRKGLEVIIKSSELVKDGYNVTIFPEGTRNKTGEDLQPFRDGALKIAEKAECPIIPIAINNTEEIFENHLPKIKKTTVVIEYCDPIYTKGMTRDEKKTLSSRVQEEILEAYRRNRELI